MVLFFPPSFSVEGLMTNAMLNQKGKLLDIITLLKAKPTLVWLNYYYFNFMGVFG